MNRELKDNNDLEYDRDDTAHEIRDFMYHELPQMVRERLSDLPVKSIYTAEVSRNNGVKVLGIFADMGVGSSSPCAYLDTFMKNPSKSFGFRDRDSIAALVSKTIRQAVSEADTLTDELITADGIYEKLGLRLINREMNRELLEQLPHKDYLDLSAILVWKVEIGGRNGVIKLNSAVIDELGYSFDELYDIALDNMERGYPFSFRPLDEVLHDLTGFKADVPMSPFYCLTVEGIGYGGIAMLYPGIMLKIYECIGEAFYVIPSSINELLILPASFTDDIYYLMDMIPSVNREAVDASEVLSDSLYYFRPETGKLEICEDDRKGIRFCTMA